MIEKFQGETRWLSNFAPVKIVMNGLTFPTTEHAYMAAKSDNPIWKVKCTEENITPGQIKRLSKEVQLVDNWETKKVEVMKECVRQKFSQNPYKKMLKDTGNQHIQEGNNWGDLFWGVDLKSGKGENILGKLIMDFRNTL